MNYESLALVAERQEVAPQLQQPAQDDTSEDNTPDGGSIDWDDWGGEGGGGL